MAITKILNIKSQSNLYNAIDYIMKPEKTKEQLWVGGNSGSTTQEVYRTMMDSQTGMGKAGWKERIPYHHQLETGRMYGGKSLSDHPGILPGISGREL